jgi:AcrR family transcriptional regulator
VVSGRVGNGSSGVRSRSGRAAPIDAVPGARVDRRGSPAATKARILAAATDEFAERGFAGARIDRIAACATSNKQLIYRYFGTKQGLYEAVMDHLVTRARTMIEEDRASGCAYLDSRQFLVGQGDVRRKWARLQSWEGLTDGVDSPALDAKRAENFEILHEWISDDQRKGRITSRFSARQVVGLVVFGRIFPDAMPKVFELVQGEDNLDSQQSWIESLRELLKP